MRCFPFLAAPRPRVADCAVVRDAGKTNHPFGKTGGHFVAFLPDEAKCLIPSRAGNVLRKNTRQNQPDIERDSTRRFGADTAVFKAFALIGPTRLGLFAEKFVPRNQPPATPRTTMTIRQR